MFSILLFRFSNIFQNSTQVRGYLEMCFLNYRTALKCNFPQSYSCLRWESRLDTQMVANRPYNTRVKQQFYLDVIKDDRKISENFANRPGNDQTMYKLRNRELELASSNCANFVRFPFK